MPQQNNGADAGDQSQEPQQQGGQGQSKQADQSSSQQQPPATPQKPESGQATTNDTNLPKTQAELDDLIQKRLNRAQEKVRSEFEGWVAPDTFKSVNEQLSSLSQERDQVQRENAALAAGLDASFGARLVGSSPEDWQKDAQSLSELMGQAKQSGGEVSRQPRERGRGGARPEVEAFDAKEVVNKIPRY